jgi:hypothetical protein
MALSAAAAIFNAAIDTLMAEWVTYCDTLTTNDQVQIVWGESNKGDNPNNSKYGAPATMPFGRSSTDAIGALKLFFKYNPNVTGDTPLEVGGRSLFFKITNDAGDLS